MTNDQLRLENKSLRQLLAKERARSQQLQAALDGRPALNAGLHEAYIRWSAAVGEMEFLRAVCTEN